MLKGSTGFCVSACVCVCVCVCVLTCGRTGGRQDIMFHFRYLSFFIIPLEVMKIRLHSNSHCTRQPVSGFMLQHRDFIKYEVSNNSAN